MDDAGKKTDYFFVLSSINVEMYERYNIEEGQTSIEGSRGKAAEEKREYKIAVFYESSEFLETIRKTK